MTGSLSRKLFILLSLAGFLPWAACAGGAGETRGEKEYGEIVNSGVRGEDMISALEDFEIRHGGHFYSKLDLGIYYLAAGETDRARDYLRRAEGLLPDTGKPPSGKENGAAVLYGALAQICRIRQDYQGALDYADRAIGEDRENRRSYRFLKGHVLIARREYPAALEIFDGLLGSAAAGNTAGSDITNSNTAGSNDDEAGAEELLAYMFLLAQAERPAEAAAALDRYFKTGAFFPGLGWFGAAVYRAAGEMEKAACAAYLEGEYRSGYGELQNPEHSGFEALEEMIQPPGGEEGGTVKAGGNYFAAEYFELKDLINGSGNFTSGEFLRLVNLEPYFRLFPSFYWNLWQGARRAYPEGYRYFSTALQKIIALDKDSPFAKGAWEELTRLMGY
jgi:tetratricopeptide (TPR) repeat protein